MAPVLRSYMTSIIDAANVEFNLGEVAFDIEMRQYTDRYIERHIAKSEYEMSERSDDPEELEKRADEWQDNRAKQIALNERVRANGAAYSFVVFAAGLSLTWRVRSSETCAYCQTLNGVKISSGQSFADDGDEIDVGDGSDPMKIRGLKTHSPLHRGCNCYVVGS